MISYYKHPIFPKIRGGVIMERDNFIAVKSSKTYWVVRLSDNMAKKCQYLSEKSFNEIVENSYKPLKFSIFYSKSRLHQSLGVQESVSYPPSDYKLIEDIRGKLFDSLEEAKEALKALPEPKKDIGVITTAFNSFILAATSKEKLLKKLSNPDNIKKLYRG
jgi:hypothetical protein